MRIYVALLRGINVGGNALVKMAELKACFEAMGLEDVRTYINSGNVVFRTKRKEGPLTKAIERELKATFDLPIRVVVIEHDRYRKMIDGAPKGWGGKDGWRYNSLFLIPPYEVDEIVDDIGELKPKIEELVVGDGVIYQALLFEKHGRTTTGKLASRPSYKRMTIRNWNTSRKVLAIMDEVAES